jgi:uroporphyrinogen-III synthase
MMMRVLVTRPRKEAVEFAQALSQIGAEAVFFPTISICPVQDSSVLDQALLNLQGYDWLIFTSANAVDIILERKAALGLEGLPEKLQIAAVGPKTAARLLKGGIAPCFTPGEYVAEEILTGLGDLNGRWVLLPVADIAHDILPRAIQLANGIAHVVTTYHTLPAEPSPEGLAMIREGVDVITFTSGSTSQNFVPLIQQAGLDPFNLPGNPAIACMGPKTAQTALELGFSVDIVASVYTTEGLVQAISNHIQKAHPHDAI